MRSAVLISSLVAGLGVLAPDEGIALEDFRNRHVSVLEAYAVEQGLTIVREPRSSTLPVGFVIEHVPGAGGVAGADGRIVAYISDGIDIPGGMTGRPVEEVLLRLEAIGLQAQVTSRPFQVPPGVVGATIPREGERIDATVDAVTVVVSSTHVPVPNVVGLRYEEARRRLRASGLLPSGELRPSFEGQCVRTTFHDRIERTHPSAGSRVPHGLTVTLVGAVEVVRKARVCF